jgi:hypothetical protein
MLLRSMCLLLSHCLIAICFMSLFVMFYLIVLYFSLFVLYFVSCFVCCAFYFVCSVFLYCFVYCFYPCVLLFPTRVQFYRPLPRGGNPIAVNKYRIISYILLLVLRFHTIDLSHINWNCPTFAMFLTRTKKVSCRIPLYVYGHSSFAISLLIPVVL